MQRHRAGTAPCKCGECIPHTCMELCQPCDVAYLDPPCTWPLKCAHSHAGCCSPCTPWTAGRIISTSLKLPSRCSSLRRTRAPRASACVRPAGGLPSASPPCSTAANRPISATKTTSACPKTISAWDATGNCRRTGASTATSRTSRMRAVGPSFAVAEFECVRGCTVCTKGVHSPLRSSRYLHVHHPAHTPARMHPRARQKREETCLVRVCERS